MRIAGIDPGKTGYIVALDIVDLHNIDGIPMCDVAEIANFLCEWDVNHVFIEKAQAMPKQGVVSVAHYMQGYGEIIGMLKAGGIPYTEVRPATWKKDQLRDMPKGKEAAVIRVNQLYPALKLKKTEHHKADAILIARYGSKHAL